MVEPARLAWGLRQACSTPASGSTRARPASALERPRGRAARRTAGRRGARRPGGARHERLPTAAAAAAADDRAGLRLRADDRAAHAGAAGVGRVGRRQGVGDASNLFHYYRLTRDDRILWGGYDAVYHYGSRVDPALEQGADPRPAGRQFFDDVPAAGGAAVHAPLGRCDRHLHPVRGVLRHGVRRPGRPTRSATPALASRPPGSAPRSRSTCWRGRRPSGPGWRWSASSRCRSRRSCRARSGSSSPAGRWPGRTRGAVGGTSGCATLDRAGLGFDS